MSKIDITDKIERLEAFEERLGVSLESISVFLDDDKTDSIPLVVCGDLLARNGTEIEESIQLVIAAYDMSGRVVKTDTKYYSATDFFGLETFEINMYLPISSISKIRIYPKKH
jgi:hypothetical protein